MPVKDRRTFGLARRGVGLDLPASMGRGRWAFAEPPPNLDGSLFVGRGIARVGSASDAAVMADIVLGRGADADSSI